MEWNPFAYEPWRSKRTFEHMFNILEADIVIMQETKIQKKDLSDDMVLISGWDVYFSLPREKKGYSGVAIYTRNTTCAPIRAEEGITGCIAAPRSTTSYRDLPEEQRIGGYPTPGQLTGRVDEATLDSEGRCVILEFPAFVLIGVYCPANRDESRDDFRTEFVEALDTRILCRYFHPKRKGMNTCWDTKKNTRPANFGSRIDYVLCTNGVKSWAEYADIQEGLMGSDHCPVFFRLSSDRTIFGEREFIHDMVNPPGMFVKGRRLRGWAASDMLPLSARLIPEFDRRRTIREMFTRQRSEDSQDAMAKKDADVKRKGEDSQDAIAKKDADTMAKKDADAMAKKDADAMTNKDADAMTKKDADSMAKKDADAKRKREDSQDATAKKDAMETSMPKRKVGGPKALAKSKRPKPASGASATSKSRPGAGQMTLAGFFKAASSDKAKASAEQPNHETVTPAQPPPASITKEARSPSAKSVVSPPSLETLPKDDPHKTPEPSQLDSSKPSPERVFDPIEAKESWSKLLGKRVVPRCNHDEPCISLVTKKPGVNCGRSFYMCPRPLGPSGEKEKDSEWRCGTFIWSSDWTRNASMPGSSD
uniref:DNA-(apurinic or apyrimidinic site) endonuclease 2 n=1 Tax=Bionectria ochroleuca TaxID=29856 RepID=A0A0B7KKA7_BIOOC